MQWLRRTSDSSVLRRLAQVVEPQHGREEDQDQDRSDRKGRLATGNAAAAKAEERKAARALALAGSKADPARDAGQRHHDERSDPLGDACKSKGLRGQDN